MIGRRAIAAACCCIVFASTRPAAAADAARGPSNEAIARIAQEVDRVAVGVAAQHNAAIARLQPQASAPTPFDRWLEGELTAIQREKSARQGRDLRALADSLRRLASASPANQPAADPHDAAAKVLAQRQYQLGGGGAAPAPQQSWWDWLLQKLGDLLGRILEGLFKAGSSAPIVGQIVAIVLLALLAAALAYIAIRIGRALWARRPNRAVDDGVALPLRADADELYARARAAAAIGAYPQAIALLFQASLAFLDGSGALTLDPSLTPGEYRRAVRRSVTAASTPFDRLANAFVMAAYAEAPASAADFSMADTAYASIREAVPS
jgi:hypothetical protein